MEFSIEFYETVTGNCPVREFLDELKRTDPDDHAVVVAGLAKGRRIVAVHGVRNKGQAIAKSDLSTGA